MDKRNLILIAFAISGFTALIYEVVWARPLQLIFGSTIYAVSTILTTFFAGFALGSYLFRNFADNSKNPLKLFALIELGIGLYGLIILWLFKSLPSIYLLIANNSGIQFIQFVLLFLVLIIPATLFGATWPIVTKAYSKEESIGKDSGNLYAFNSLGSFLGPIIAGFSLIPILGIKTTSILIAFLNMSIGTLILLNSRRKDNEF